MKKLWVVVFVIAVVIVGIETFRPQAPFPGVSGAAAQLTSLITH